MGDICLNILIIEDQDSKNKAIIEFVLSVFDNVNFETANCQVKALEILEKTKFDLMFLDMCLPLRIGDELDYSGGENILDDLDVNDIYIRPSVVVAVTQFDELQEEVRMKFPELGAIKFSNESIDWQSGIERIVKSCVKSKKVNRTIVYCEEKNDVLFNLVGLENIEFRGLRGGSRKVYEYAKFDKKCYAVRDKDFLTRKEVSWLTESKFENYLILDYYCFENYLYHPENLCEYFNTCGEEFDKAAYIEEIIEQKNSKLLKIVQGIDMSRNGYYDFTDNQRKNMDKEPEVVKCLESNSFEVFYPYFDMKGTNKDKGFDKEFLADKNIDKMSLASTEWFKNKMRIVFSKVLN